MNKPRRASISPFRHGGYKCIANHVLLWLKSCPTCNSPMTTMSKVKRAADYKGEDAALTWMCVVMSGVKVMKGDVCEGCS